ncbi:isochorismatase family protein [Citrobacter sp. Cu233]|uniref:cysteine hydrolase family protein n=1 Tax=Citrobacter sp. Cu233 TaxID=2985160 RepID=UPI002575DFB3|nr:isochorismatase family protein [Citrobacter sp. Cu233]MDM2932866.1 isochorismatase family protein [Citrobacter sp. Cu233]
MIIISFFNLLYPGEIMTTALLVVDMQNFVTDRINQGVEMFPHNAMDNMRTILDIFRNSMIPVIHIRHHSTEEGSLLHHSTPLSQPVKGFEEKQGEPVFVKNTSSAFSSTGLLTYLKDHQLSTCIVIGAVAGFCVTSTVRAGADAGLKMTVIQDAVISFALKGGEPGAKTILDVTLALLAADFATVVTTKELNERLSKKPKPCF